VKVLARNMLGIAIAATLVGAVTAGGTRPPSTGKTVVSHVRDNQPTDRFIVKFRDASTPFHNATARQLALDHAVKAFGASARTLHRMGVGADVIKLDHKLSRVAAIEFVRVLKQDPNVEYAQIDELKHPATFTPDDPQFASQWHYTDANGGINLPDSWDLSRGNGIVVAVIDTGITSHSDLNANVVAGYDFISDAAVSGDGDALRDADPSDPGDYVKHNECYTGSGASNSSWHGTHVSGTIAAITNNGIGVAGVARNVKLMPLKVM